MRRPNAVFLRAYLRRGASLWLGARTFASAAILFAQGNPVELTTTIVVLMVGLAVALGLLETWRRRERALLGNLGVSFAVLVVVLGTPALLGELGLRLLWAGVR